MAYKVNEDIEWKKIDKESLILIPTKSEFYKLNTTGTIILEGIYNGKDLDEIARLLSEEYDVILNECKEDVGELTKELKKLGIIV